MQLTTPSLAAERHYAANTGESFEQAKTRYMLAAEGEDITNELQGLPAELIAWLLKQDDSDAKVGLLVRKLMENCAERLAMRDVRPMFPRAVMSADQCALAVMTGKLA